MNKASAGEVERIKPECSWKTPT